MNHVTKTVVLAVALSALPLATLYAADVDKKAKEWPTFKKADADNNGNISMDEARTVGTGLADNFAQYDKNSDGQLSRSEYESAKKGQKPAKSGAAPEAPARQPEAPSSSPGSATPPAAPTR